MRNDTIAAISTPSGEGGIGIIRISGPEAYEIAKKVFICKKKRDESFPLPRYMYYGHVQDAQEKIVDEALVSFMPAPATYTREDVVEINCHSGTVNLRLVLKAVLAEGARLAEPGEFTKRAFISGRIDLMQAESVMKIIKSRSEEGTKKAASALSGKSSGIINELRARVLSLQAQIEAGLDYPEEIAGQQNNLIGTVKKELIIIAEEITNLLKGVERNRFYIEGIPVAIIGRPNVGKSSLLNALLKQNKAITHEIPGTTRDTLEGAINTGGYPLKIIDTAGIQETADPVETQGIERSHQVAASAKILMIVLDGSEQLNENDLKLKGLRQPEQLQIIVVNKNDLPQVVKVEDIEKHFHYSPIVKISALKNIGITDLEGVITEIVDNSTFSGDDHSSLISMRHEIVAHEALKSIHHAIIIADRQPVELICYELNSAWLKLGEITGETVNKSILDEIFTKFCLGK